MTTPSHALAVIDGSLCRLARSGGRAVWHQPIATAVVEFRRGPMCTYVREHPYGLLPGLANLYCLDGAHRLCWIAEWPLANNPCSAILGERDGSLLVAAGSGTVLRIDGSNGRFLGFAESAVVAS